LQQGYHLLPQEVEELLLFLATPPSFQAVQQEGGGLYAHIGAQQELLRLLPQGIVPATLEERSKTAEPGAASGL
jgi:hypothetical protein